MNTNTNTVRRGVSVGLLGALGAAVAVATWLGGDGYLAVILAAFYALCCGAAWVWSRGSGDLAAVIGFHGDERQRSLDLRATAVAGVATLAFCLAGTVVDLARGGSGNPWAIICAVGGTTYVLALLVLRGRA